VAAAALVPMAFMLTGPVRFTSTAAMGAQTFQLLAFLAFLSAMLAAVRLTADCLSSEKRDGTLGFLFLTDLKASDVVIGKLAATSLNALYGLLALLPVLTIPVLCGGVTLADVTRLAFVLLNGLFFALSLAMMVSALNWEERKAVGMTVVLLFAIGGGLPLAGSIVESSGGSRLVAGLLNVASPGYACRMVMSASYGISPQAFWVSVAVTHVLGWLFLWVTCRVLPHVWQDRPAGGWLLRWREWCRQALMGNPVSRATFRRQLFGVNPIFWLASRERRTWWYPWIFLGSVAAIGGFTCWVLKVKGVEFAPVIFSSFLLHAFFKHWIATEACYALSTDRDRGALELLLSTPLAMKDVVRGHWLALSRRFLAPVFVVMAVELVLLFVAVQTKDSSESASVFFWLALALFGLVVFVADVFALIWVGWWSGVVSKNASGAVSATYLRLFLIPWMLALGAWAPLMIWFDPPTEGGSVLALVLWVVTSLWADVFYGRRARAKIHTELRLAAVERYGGGDSSMRWWRRLGLRLAQRSTHAPLGIEPVSRL
jgi:ABC-type Na+ efflux pump permease subunit